MSGKKPKLCGKKLTSNADVVILNVLSLKYALIILIEERKWGKESVRKQFLWGRL